MRYRKQPIVIEAMQFKTNNEVNSPNMDAIVNWINQGRDTWGAWHNGTDIFINTLEGIMKAEVKDWIIRGVKREFYPCKPDIFAATYEREMTDGNIFWYVPIRVMCLECETEGCDGTCGCLCHAK